MRGTLLLVSVLLLALPAVAQGPVPPQEGPAVGDTTIDPSGPVPPGTQATLTVHWTWDCQEAMTRTVLRGGSDPEMRATYRNTSHPAITLGGEDTYTVDTAPCEADPAAPLVGTWDVPIQIAEGAPGLVALDVRFGFRVPAEAADQVPATASRNATASFMIGYLPDLDLSADVTALEGEPPFTYNLTLSNQGNAETTVRLFTSTQGITLTPDRIALGYGDDTDTVTTAVRVEVSDAVPDGPLEVAMEYLPVATADDGLEGEPIRETLQLMVDRPGGDNGSPPVSLLPAALALLGTALLARRRAA